MPLTAEEIHKRCSGKEILLVINGKIRKVAYAITSDDTNHVLLLPDEPVKRRGRFKIEDDNFLFGSVSWGFSLEDISRVIGREKQVVKRRLKTLGLSLKPTSVDDSDSVDETYRSGVTRRIRKTGAATCKQLTLPGFEDAALDGFDSK